MKKRKLWLTRGLGILMSICFIALGVMEGEPLEVMKKAVSICLQCIGIG